MSDPIRKRKWDDEPAPTAPATAGEDHESKPKVVKVDEEASVKSEGGAARDPAEAAAQAAEVAARIAAQYAPKPVVPEVPYVAGAREAQDPEFVKDIEINDIRNRYVVTKGPTQQKIFVDTGANVITKGVWVPDKAMATDKDPPLYLHITADTAEKLEAGVKAVQELIDQELGPLIDQSRFRDRDAPRERRKWPEEKIFLELEVLRNFNVRAKVVGPAGLFVKYIQQETQTRVQIKGLGSGFIETETGRESEDAMHIHVTSVSPPNYSPSHPVLTPHDSIHSGPDQVMVDKATEMARDLLVVVTEEHAKAKAVLEQGFQQQQQQQQQYPQQGYGQQQQGYNQGYAQQAFVPGLTAPLPAGEAPPPPPSDGAPPPPPPSALTTLPVPPQQAGGTATQEEWEAYWHSLGAEGQHYYMTYYAPVMAAQAAVTLQPQGYSPAPPPSSAPPPPPPAPSDDGPRGGKGVYGAVRPPAGL